MNSLQSEWSILHADIERYARYSLAIKLFSVFISVVAVSFLVYEWFSIAVILVLWLQDGIWVTFQNRIETRVLMVERQIQTVPDLNSDSDRDKAFSEKQSIDTTGKTSAFQLYSQWQEKRLGTGGTILEYVKNSLRPTVAYPYVVIVVLMLIVFQYAVLS